MIEINYAQILTNVVTQLGIFLIIYLISSKLLDRWAKRQDIKEKEFIYQSRKVNSMLIALIRLNGTLPNFQRYYQESMDKYASEDEDKQNIILKR